MVSKNAQRFQLNLGSLLSSWFVWGAITQQIAVVIYEEDQASVVVYKARDAEGELSFTCKT